MITTKLYIIHIYIWYPNKQKYRKKTKLYQYECFFIDYMRLLILIYLIFYSIKTSPKHIKETKKTDFFAIIMYNIYYK